MVYYGPSRSYGGRRKKEKLLVEKEIHESKMCETEEQRSTPLDMSMQRDEASNSMGNVSETQRDEAQWRETRAEKKDANKEIQQREIAAKISS